jgi:hypothetical protein
LLTNLFIYLEPLTLLVKEQLAVLAGFLKPGSLDAFPPNAGESADAKKSAADSFEFDRSPNLIRSFS